MAIVKYPTLPQENEISKVENIQPTFEPTEIIESSDEETCKETWEKIKSLSNQLISLIFYSFQLVFTKFTSKFIPKTTRPPTPESLRIQELQTELEIKEKKIKQLSFYLVLFSIVIVLFGLYFNHQQKKTLNQFSRTDNLYHKLKVDPNASNEQIDSSFIEFMRNSNSYYQRYEMRNAYLVLSDAKTRQQYNEFLKSSSNCCGTGCFMFVATISCLIFALYLRRQSKK
jgi:hypothetical protein